MIWSKVFLLFSMGCVLFNSGGCVGVGHVTLSWPTFVGEGRNYGEKDYPTLHLSQINIQVLAHNGDSLGFFGPVVPLVPVWEKHSGGPFWVGILLDPQAEDFTFDPFKIILEVDGGQQLDPAGFTGPFMATKSNTRSFCSEAFDAKGWKTEPATFSAIGEMCFGIAYNIVTPKPDDKFLVFVEGLQKEERPVSVPKIQFEKKARWQWFFWPKLWD
jgi:hypothetical protein